MTINADTIIRLLAAKHTRDLFVGECKTGATWGTACLRLDAWAMRRSWAHPCVWGYEVKVSRADFLADDKWPGYLAYCNRFAFVAPQGVIQPEELGPGVGLLVVAKTGSRLWTKRKAAHRDAEVPEELYRYLLMSRVRIVPPNHYSSDMPQGAGYWRQWLTEKAENIELGRLVGGRMRRLFDERVTAVELENIRLKARHKEYDRVRALLDSLGIDGESGIYLADAVRKRAERMRQVVPQELIYALDNLERATTIMRARLKEIDGAY